MLPNLPGDVPAFALETSLPKILLSSMLVVCSPLPFQSRECEEGEAQ